MLGVSLVGATAVPVGYYALHARGARPRSACGGVGAGRGRTGARSRCGGDAAAALLTEELGALDHARVALANGEAPPDARRAGRL